MLISSILYLSYTGQATKCILKNFSTSAISHLPFQLPFKKNKSLDEKCGSGWNNETGYALYILLWATGDTTSLLKFMCIPLQSNFF